MGDRGINEKKAIERAISKGERENGDRWDRKDWLRSASQDAPPQNTASKKKTELYRGRGDRLKKLYYSWGPPSPKGPYGRSRLYTAVDGRDREHLRSSKV